MNNNLPKDGDFASYLERREKQKNSIENPEKSDVGARSFSELSSELSSEADRSMRQTMNEVPVVGHELTEEFIEEMNALENAPQLSDEELERQALSDPGSDDDVSTPE